MENIWENILFESMLQGSLENQFDRSAIVQQHSLSMGLQRKCQFFGGFSGPYFTEERRDITISRMFLETINGIEIDIVDDDWDGKMTSQVQDESTGCNLNTYVELDEPFNLEEHKKAVQRVSSSISPLDIADYYKTQKYEDDLSMWKKYGIEKDVENDDWDGKKTSQLQDKFTDCNLNKYEEPFSKDKRKETVQRVISCLMATVVFFWFMFYTFTQSSIMQLQPFHKEHGLIFIWSSLIEPFCFMVLIWAIATSIVVGSSSSRMQSAMLMFWAILILVKSAKSITEVYVPILGILFTGCYMFVEKQPLAAKL